MKIISIFATMKRILASLVFLVLLCAPEAGAQSLGQLHYGDLVFSTCLPHNPKEPITMSEERLKIALNCIRRTFGDIREYEEYYGECCGMHHLEVLLESGDVLDFEEGRLCGFTLVSSRFTVAKEWFKGGLRVGRKPSTPKWGYYHRTPKRPSRLV